jgi:hypothetical protein
VLLDGPGGSWPLRNGYYSSPPEEQKTFERPRAQSVPIVIVDAERDRWFASAFRQVAEAHAHFRSCRGVQTSPELWGSCSISQIHTGRILSR